MSDRLLKTTDIPGSLWRGEEDLLLLPGSLCSAYGHALDSNGLTDAALAGNVEDGPVGGIKDEDTQRHFSTRFSGSSARVQLAAIDPKDHLRSASDLFVRAFSGGKVGLLDIPCGAGAAIASLLGSVAELRAAKVLPREPLEVFLVGGDVSSYAQSYASEVLHQMRPALERESIWVSERWVSWDVQSAESTANLLHTWMEWAHDCREYFVVMANFSGFLRSAGKMKEAQPQLDQILLWAAQRRSSVVWVEPPLSTSPDGLMGGIIKWFRRTLPSLYSGTWVPETSVGTTKSLFQHPLRSDYRPPARLNLIRLEVSDP